ncbi:MAG: DUF4402 domain-containing protein [Sphingomicrobium sp.]
MKKFLGTAGAVALLELTSTAAQAATSPSAQATATAKIYHPLTIAKTQNLDFGVIVISGASFAAEAVTVSTAGAVTCGGGTNLVCSGSPTAASFHLAGNDNALVTVSSPAFNLTGPSTLAVTPSSTSQSVNLGASGSTTGVDVALGGSINVGSATPEGVYSGTWTVTADYQ